MNSLSNSGVNSWMSVYRFAREIKWSVPDTCSRSLWMAVSFSGMALFSISISWV